MEPGAHTPWVSLRAPPICETARMAEKVYQLSQALLPDGTVVWEERGKARDLLAELRRYDPMLSLVRDVSAGVWLIYRRDENGGQYRVFHCEGDLLPDVERVIH